MFLFPILFSLGTVIFGQFLIAYPETMIKKQSLNYSNHIVPYLTKIHHTKKL